MRLLFILVFSVPSYILSQPEPLATNERTTYHIHKKEIKEFSIDLEERKNYTIIVEQKGIDVGLRMKNTKGEALIYKDSPNGMYGPETIAVTTRNSVTVHLFVEPLQEKHNSRAGEFSIIIEEGIRTDSLVTAILSPEQMKEDLEVFRKIREKANSGLYIYRTNNQIDSIYNLAAGKIQQPMHLTDFYKIILELTDFEGSNHNFTLLPHEVHNYIRDSSYFPFHFKQIEGKMIVNYEGGELPLGSQVLSINGISSKDLQKRLSNYITTDGYNQTAKERLSIENGFGWIFAFETGIHDSFTVEFKRPHSENIEVITLKSISREENKARYLNRYSSVFESIINPDMQEKYSFSQLNDYTALLNFRRFDMASGDDDPAYKVYCRFLDSVFTSLRKQGVRNLIIDIRNNPGGSGSNSETAFTYLADQPFKENRTAHIIFQEVPFPHYYKWESTDADNQKRELEGLNRYFARIFSNNQNGSYFQNKKYNPVFKPKKKRFSGNIYLLVDENVASAASHFASLVRGYTDATIVGMETSGGYYAHNGHFPVKYVLPNSRITTGFSIVHVQQDAPLIDSQPIGRGIIPDHNVSQSFGDFMDHEDTQMKFVLQLIEQNR